MQSAVLCYVALWCVKKFCFIKQIKKEPITETLQYWVRFKKKKKNFSFKMNCFWLMHWLYSRRWRRRTSWSRSICWRDCPGWRRNVGCRSSSRRCSCTQTWTRSSTWDGSCRKKSRVIFLSCTFKKWLILSAVRHRVSVVSPVINVNEPASVVSPLFTKQQQWVENKCFCFFLQRKYQSRQKSCARSQSSLTWAQSWMNWWSQSVLVSRRDDSWVRTWWTRCVSTSWREEILSKWKRFVHIYSFGFF